MDMGASFGLIVGASLASIYQKYNGFLLLGTRKYCLPPTAPPLSEGRYSIKVSDSDVSYLWMWVTVWR